MHVPYVFPRVNVLSPISNTLLTLRNPRYHIYGVKRLLIPHILQLDQDPTVLISPRGSPLVVPIVTRPTTPAPTHTSSVDATEKK